MNNEDFVDYVVIVKSIDSWYWRAMSNNGRKVAIGGEPFSSRAAAESAAKGVVKFSGGEKVFLDGSDELAQYQKEVHGNG